MAEPSGRSGVATRPDRRRFWLTLGAVSALGLTCGVGLQVWRAKSELVPEVEQFWGASLSLADGRQVPVAQWRGHPLLVNFWATWCPPCVEEMPMLDRFFAEKSGKGRQVLGIAVDKLKSVQTFLAASPVRYPIAVEPIAGAQLARDLGNLSGGLPFSLFFSSDGAVARRKMGKLTGSDLDAWSQGSR